MKIEEVVLQRDALCRGPGQKQYHMHDLKRGDLVVKLGDVYVGGGMQNIFMCKKHAKMLMEELSSMCD